MFDIRLKTKKKLVARDTEGSHSIYLEKTTLYVTLCEGVKQPG